MKTAVDLLLTLGLVLSLLPALDGSGRPPREGPAVMEALGDIYFFLVRVSIWPFLFLQLLLCRNTACLPVMLLPLAACALLFAAGMAWTIANPGAGGILVMILTLFYSAVPAMGALLGLAVWAACRLFVGLAG